MKKYLYILVIIIFFLSLAVPFASANDEVKVYLFYRYDCPHCEKEIEFLNNLASHNPTLKLFSFEIAKNKSNLKLLVEVGKRMSADVTGVPFTVIGDWTISGYTNDITTGSQIKKQIDYCAVNECPDTVGNIINDVAESNKEKESQDKNNLLEKIYLPVFGEIDVKNFSLPILTIIIGALDGFNPCAMWVLLFLISLLLGMKDRRRMWILGSTFIVASSAVYFLFMVAWLNLLIFLGFIIWIRLLIGGVALGSGGYHLKEYWQNREGYCKVTGSEKRQRIFARLKEITQSKSFILAFLGIIVLAFAVNLVELVCSAGLPAVYTQILTMSDLSPAGYYLYILLYIFIFMLDDLLVFIIAMVTLQATGFTSKYSRYSNLIGGLLMVVLGLLLLFKPEWLMFG